MFDKVKATCDLKEKIHLVNGDVAELSLGLSPEELKLIEENVHIVLHGAATVKFDEKIRLAANINARGTLELLKIATRMPNLQVKLFFCCNCGIFSLIFQYWMPHLQ